MPAGHFSGAVRAKFPPHLGCGAARGGVGSDFERFYIFLSFKASNHFFPLLLDAARAPPAPARRGQLVAALLEEADDGTLIYARARVDDFKEVRA